MRREERAKSVSRAVRVGLVCLVPALSLLLSLLVTRPALAAGQLAGQLNIQLEAEAGVRSDGNYAQRTTPVDPTGSEPLSSRQQSFGRGGFNLNLSYVLRRWELALVYSPFYEAGFQNRDFAGLTHRLNLSLSGNLSARTTLRLSERLLSSPTLELFGPTLGDTVVSPRTGRQLFQDFDAEIDSDLTRRTVLFLGADEFLRTFKEPGLVDSRGAGGRAGLRFHLDEERQVELKAGASSYAFGPGRSANVAVVTAAYSKVFERDSAVRLELGGFSVTSQGGQVGPVAGSQRELRSQGLQGVLDLTHERERFRYNASLRHGVAPGVGIGRPVVLDNLVLGVSTVGRRVTVGLSGSAARSQDFQNAVDRQTTAGSGRSSDRRLVDFVAGNLDASWNFTDWGRLHGGYSRIWQSSRIAAFDTVAYNRYFLGLALQIYHTGEKPENPAEQGGLNVKPHTP
jgi:hypothetical protein